jgi:hypothetical protein
VLPSQPEHAGERAQPEARVPKAAGHASASTFEGTILRLQASAGNQAVVQFLAATEPELAARSSSDAPDIDATHRAPRVIGTDMTAVSLHAGSGPAQLRRKLQAKTSAIGTDLFFAKSGTIQRDKKIKKTGGAVMDRGAFGKDAAGKNNVPSGKDVEAWQPVLQFVDYDADDATKMDGLIRGFKAFNGFEYTGTSKTWALKGDCTSVAFTFKAIAENLLNVQGVKIAGYNGGKGWYLGPGLHEIDKRAARDPNVSNGGYFFGMNHTWVEWNGTVYDALFGETGQNGREPDEFKKITGPDKKVTTYFRIGAQWFKAGAVPNTYEASEPPPT